MNRNNEVLFAVGFVLIALAVLFLAWVCGVWSLTPPVPNRSPIESLPKIERGPGLLQVEIGGRVVTVEEKR